MEKGLGGAAGGTGWGGEERGTQLPAAASSPLPPVGALSRALIGAAAAAGRVSAASLRDATPSNCGRDRRYAAASCPGARPGRPRPRPAPCLPAGPPLRLPAARGDTEARLGGDVSGRPEPSPDCVRRLERPQTSRSAGPGAPIRATAGARSESASLVLALPLARPQTSPPRKSSSDCFGIQWGASN